MRLALVLLLLAAPLAAQQDSTVVRIVTLDGDTVMVNVEVLIRHEANPLPDSLLANFDRNMAELARLIAEDNEESATPANRTTKIAVGVLIPVLVWIALELRGIKNRPPDVQTQSQEQNVEPHDHKREHDDDESGES